MSSEKAITLIPFLLEIGCEEIPARFLEDAEKGLGAAVGEALRSNRLAAEGSPPLRTFSTPRRLVVWAPQVLERQEELVSEILGPPVRVGLDAKGKPTRAAESFAAKNSAVVEDLIRVTTPKGDYLALKKRTAGLSAFEVLLEVLPGTVTSLSFPKAMYWVAKSGPRFVRPIRWMVALLGEGDGAKVVPFEVAGVRAGDATYGLRTVAMNAGTGFDSRPVVSQAPIRVQGFADYCDKLRVAKVEVEASRRREMLQNEIDVKLKGIGLNLLEDKALDNWIVNSCEWPRVVLGDFAEKYRQLPREILITVMRDHQKYFAVVDRQGNLQPYFIAVINVDGDEKGWIKAGHERVLTARFADAEFFWKTDQKIPLRERVPLIEKVTYQEKLGSYAEKVRRMKLIAGEICKVLETQGRMTQPEVNDVLRAVQICKCDLTTQMVQEFTELQGVVGGLYARVQAEPEEVAQAIYDHYKPQGLEDLNPQTLGGAVLSFADKLDSVIAGFAVGYGPTGSSDPFGLRRAGNGVVKLAMEALTGTDLRGFIGTVMDLYSGFTWVNHLDSQVDEFLRERTEYYLQASAGLRYDTVRAIVQSFSGWSPPAEALKRGIALEQVRDTEDFQVLATAAKRTRNILNKSAKAEDFGDRTEVDEGLLQAPEEIDLHSAYLAVRQALAQLEALHDYVAAFGKLAGLRPLVDLFFDKVMVMDQDLLLRSNRLRLLMELNEWVFTRFADLSQIESNALTPVGASTTRRS